MNLNSADMHACNYLLQQVIAFSVNTMFKSINAVHSDLTYSNKELEKKCKLIKMHTFFAYPAGQNVIICVL